MMGSWIAATIAYVRDPLGAHRRLQARYGDPFSTFLGPTRISVTGRPEGIAAIFGTPAATFAPSALRLGELAGQQSVLALEGPAHTAIRRTLNAVLLDRRSEVSAGVIAEIARRQIATWPRGRPVAAMPLLARISLEVIIRVVIGVRDPARVEAFARAFEALTASASMLLVLVPALRRDLGRWSPWRRFARARDHLHAMLREEIAAARSAGAGAGRTDALAQLVLGGPQLDDAGITENLVAVLNAGHMSTASALAWAIHWTWSSEGVLDRLRGELADFAGDGGPEAALRLPYLDAVCRETLRIRPVAPMVARDLAQPLEVGGQCLRPGTAVAASIDLAHHDPAVFPEPDRFDPGRFLGARYRATQYLPFGGGHRHCLGAWLALDEMRLVLAVLATGPRLRLVSRATPQRRFSGALLIPAGGIKIVLERNAA